MGEVYDNMKLATIIIIGLIALSVIAIAGDTGLTKEAPISISLTKEQDTYLKSKTITEIKIIGSDCGNAKCYRLDGDIKEDLIKIPNTIKTRYYERQITDKEKENILAKAFNEKLNRMIPNNVSVPKDTEERDVVLTSPKE